MSHRFPKRLRPAGREKRPQLPKKTQTRVNSLLRRLPTAGLIGEIVSAYPRRSRSLKWLKETNLESFSAKNEDRAEFLPSARFHPHP